MQSEFFERISKIYKLGFYDIYDIYRFVIYKKIKPIEFEMITGVQFDEFQFFKPRTNGSGAFCEKENNK